MKSGLPTQPKTLGETGLKSWRVHDVHELSKFADRPPSRIGFSAVSRVSFRVFTRLGRVLPALTQGGWPHSPCSVSTVLSPIQLRHLAVTRPYVTPPLMAIQRKRAMKIIHTVTITGADDGTDIEDLAALSAEFPFVQWGGLVSKSQEGGPRFPSRPWIDELGNVVSSRHLRAAMHLCGRWMRELLTGDLAWNDLPAVANFAQAYQFNTHGVSVTPSPDDFLRALDERKSSRTFIFQWNALSEPLAVVAHKNGFWSAGLFDSSGGAGKLPSGGWPSPHAIPLPMGFAGGLGRIGRKTSLVTGPTAPSGTTWSPSSGPRRSCAITSRKDRSSMSKARSRPARGTTRIPARRSIARRSS